MTDELNELLPDDDETDAGPEQEADAGMSGHEILAATVAAQALANDPDVPRLVGADLRRLLRALRPLMDLLQEKELALQEEFAEVDAEGRIVVNPEDDTPLIRTGDRWEFKKRHRALMAERHPVDVVPMKASILNTAPLNCPHCRRQMKHAPRFNALALANLGKLLDETA